MSNFRAVSYNVIQQALKVRAAAAIFVGEQLSDEECQAILDKSSEDAAACQKLCLEIAIDKSKGSSYEKDVDAAVERAAISGLDADSTDTGAGVQPEGDTGTIAPPLFPDAADEDVSKSSEETEEDAAEDA